MPLTQAVKDFLAFEISEEGQAIVEENGFYPLDLRRELSVRHYSTNSRAEKVFRFASTAAAVLAVYCGSHNLLYVHAST